MAKKRLLLVDDMECVYEVAKLKLGRTWEIDYASNQTQALRKIREDGNYDVVMSDYFLSDKAPQGGLKVVKAAQAKGLRAVLMSMENHRKEAQELGVEFVFKKNFPASVRKSAR